MGRTIAPCGLVCSDCDAYVATQANDLEALERLAQHAREAFGMEDATAETTMCDGCLADDGRQIRYCATCEIRACAMERSVVNCAHCTEYACEKLEGFFAHATEACSVLDEIRQSL
jgi:predicted small metal-binding protein